MFTMHILSGNIKFKEYFLYDLNSSLEVKTPEPEAYGLLLAIIGYESLLHAYLLYKLTLVYTCANVIT